MPVMTAAYMRQYRALRAIREADGGLLPFQRRFVEAVCRQTSPPPILRRCRSRVETENRGCAARWWRGR